MKNTLETRLGLFFALALVVAFVVMEMVGSFRFFRSGVRVSARFNTVQELSEGDPVKMAGVTVGRVEDIGIDEAGGQVSVRMKLESVKGVKTDSKATIRFSGFMGQNYVALSFGSAAGASVADGTELETTEQPDLGAIMSKLDNVATGVEKLTDSLTGVPIGDLIGPLTDMLREERPRISAIFDNLKTISTRIAEGQGTVGKLINDDALHQSALAAVTNLSATADDIRLTIADARVIVRQISEGQGTIGKLTQDEALYLETTAAMTNLKEILQKINQGSGTVGKLVNDDSFYRNAKLSLQKLDKATESLEDQGPLSVLGIAVGSLF
jgi:phospholipid/cholesterol/gamma-HCH transport system substrate-binding protein